MAVRCATVPPVQQYMVIWTVIVEQSQLRRALLAQPRNLFRLLATAGLLLSLFWFLSKKCVCLVTLHILLQTGQIREFYYLNKLLLPSTSIVLLTVLWNHDFKYLKMVVVTMESNAHNITLCHSQKYCIMLIPDQDTEHEMCICIPFSDGWCLLLLQSDILRLE